MFQSLFNGVKNSPFASPFQAKCEDLKVNPTRTIAAAPVAPEGINRKNV